MPVLVLLLASAGLSVSASDSGTSDTWFLNGRKIYVAPDSPPVQDGTVMVREGRIVAVGSRSRVAVPPGARKSDCSGGVITAGFQNSHVHFTGPEFRNAKDAEPEALRQALADMLVRYGYTSVVDTASDRDNTIALRSRIDAGEILGPRILTVGNALFPVDGLPAYIAHFPKSLLDRLAQPATPASAKAVVDANLVAGADGTKLFVATPQADGTIRRMPLPIAHAAAEATHRRGMLVMAHPTDLEGIRMALASGVDILVHTTLGVAAAWPETLVQQLVDQHVAVVPTLKLGPYELDKEQVPDQVQ